MKNYFSDLFHNHDNGGSLRLDINPENAQDIASEAENLHGLMLDGIRSILGFMSVTLAGSGTPSDALTSGRTHAISIMADLMDILDDIEASAEAKKVISASK